MDTFRNIKAQLETHGECLEIKALAPKPSQAIKAMIRGLKKADKRKDFEVDMETFGQLVNKPDGMVCVGCAATCALQEMAKKRFRPTTGFDVDDLVTRADCLEISPFEVEIFESVIDRLRTGSPDTFIMFYMKEFGLSEKDFKNVKGVDGPMLTDAYLEVRRLFRMRGAPGEPITTGPSQWPLLNDTWKRYLPAWQELSESLRRAGH